MKRIKRFVGIVLPIVLFLAGCGNTGNTIEMKNSEETQNAEERTASEADNTGSEKEEADTTLAKIDGGKWYYNEEDNVYWQVGISYCENPASEEYETLGIFVPGDYMEASANGDGTYTCEIDTEAVVGVYTSQTAPIVIPVDTPGYSAMAAPADYVSAAAEYTSAGFIYVNAGCRGRDDGAPAGVTDLKAAIRYIRYNEGNIPGSMERIFSFGMSGGGAQSALLGATGDSELYAPYLEAIGAVSGYSDAVTGSMCWCPITNLDYADEAYEWNMGVTRTGLDEEMQQLSDNMAEAFALYINELELTDEEGNVLTLAESEEGIYQAGTYYEYLKAVVERSLNNFLQDTTFPYDTASGGQQLGRGGNAGGRGGLGELPEGDFLNEDLKGGNLPEGGFMKDDFKGGELPEDGELDEKPLRGNFGEAGTEYQDNINRNETSGGITLSGTYETVQDYIDALNEETNWVTYDDKTNTATITSIADFVSACKIASKNVGAFDDLEATQGENTLFGYGDGAGAHFDAVMAELLKDNTVYGEAYANDMIKTDAFGNTVDYRLNMYNPMYYLSDYYEGYQTSNVAEYWRIRTGINQGDTALTTEVNLALALENYGVDVDFETVWGQAHVEAERTGSSSENFIAWVNECLN